MSLTRFASLLVLGGAIAVGCSSEGGGLDTDAGSGGSGTDSGVGGATGGGATGGGSATGGSGASSSSGGAGAGSSSGGSSSGGTDLGGMAGEGPMLPTDIKFEYDPSLDKQIGTCAAKDVASEEIYLDMFVILDKSGSMTSKPDPDGWGANDNRGNCDIGDANTGSRWCNSINALHGFFADPSSANTGFSYGEFESTGCGAFDMDVPFGVVEAGDANGQLSALVTALNDDNPGGWTHTEGAVNTLIAETTSHQPAASRKTIAVLITDGEPTNSCLDGNSAIEEMQELNGLLVQHLSDHDIPTFIIGMDGVDAANLEALAVGAGAEIHTSYCIPGDTDCSYYSVGDGNPQVFIDALDSIRKAVVGCEFTVPSADVGVENLSTLDVQFTPDTGETPIGLQRVNAAGDCSADDEYWVDFPAAADPIIRLCPATCDSRGDGASVAISLKCEGS